MGGRELLCKLLEALLQDALVQSVRERRH